MIFISTPLRAILLLALAACALTAQGGPATHQYFRFSPTRLRNPDAGSVQLSEMQLFLGTTQINGATASNPGGNNPGGEPPANAVDGILTSKWLDFNIQPLVLSFAGPVTIDGYRWGTANDAIDRDPVRWTLEGSDDNLNWTLLDDRSDSEQTVTTEREVLLPQLDLNLTADIPSIALSISAGGVMSDTAVGVASGEPVVVAWDVQNATSQTLDLGAGPGPANAVDSINDNPAATRIYTLTASNATGTASSTVTAFVGLPVIAPVINEIMAAPTSDGVLYDEDGDASDWIELANPNNFALNVGGYYLSDDATGMTRWQIPAGTSIAPSGYLVIFASSKDRAVAGSELHTSFKLGSDGEYLALLEPDGVTVTDGYSPGFPAQFTDVSHGRVPPLSGGAYDFFTVPTPGAENDTPPGPPGEVVTFDTPAQTFTSTLDVALSAVSPTAEIRYTVDGGIPDAGSTLYSEPIALTGSTLVRARIYDAGFAPGEVKAEAYIKLDPAVAAQDSDLPVVILENFGAGPVPAGELLQSSYFTLYEPDPVTGRTDLTSPPTKANRTGIKRRGSSTLNDPKGNYRVEFWQDDSEQDKEIKLLGMSKHDEWILFAPYNFDRAMVRNSFIQELSNDIGAYAPRTRFCEVYLNTDGDVGTGDYQGVYVLMERISRDPDRVDIDSLGPGDVAEPEVSGGYILSIDRLDAGDQGFRSALDHPEDPAIASPQPWFNYVYPKEQNILPEQSNYIRGYVDDLEAALYGPDFKDPLTGYAAWLDVDASIDHHILKTFSKDPDALRLSTYLVKPRGGKLGFGPIWDSDRTMGCDQDSRPADPAGWDPPNETAQYFIYDYWGRLFEDEDFQQKWIDRWQQLRDGEFSNAAMVARVAGLAAEITESQPRNNARWPEVAPNGGDLSALAEWPGEVDHLQNWVTLRADWIDTQFTPRPLLQASGQVNPGDAVTATPVTGTLYYTTDGSDPRLPGGGIHPDATAMGGDLFNTTLVSSLTTPIDVLVPSTATPGPTAWTFESFDPVGWQSGNFAVGYDYNGVDIDVTNPSGGEPTSVYVRAPFTIADPSSLTSMSLRVKFDDGFIAYLNGVEIQAVNQPAALAWNSAATADHNDALAVNFIEFDVTDKLGALVPGSNVLAIHALNVGTENPNNTGSTSSDMLMSAELVAVDQSPGIVVNTTTSITARALDGSEWSGPVIGNYIVGAPATAANLVVSEIMYHPVDATPAEASAGFTVASDFEFVEIQNISNDPVDLTGVVFSGAFDFALTGATGLDLAPGAVTLVVRNTAAFEARYGTGLPVSGQWGGPSFPDGGQKLSNGGETLTITGLGSNIIQSFLYDDEAGWPQGADGAGFALALADPFAGPDHSLGASWRDSIAWLGSPGAGYARFYDEWAATYFTPAEAAAPGISGESADPDGDGLSNLIELGLVGNPVANSLSELPTAEIRSLTVNVPMEGDYLTISFMRRSGLAGLSVEPRFSDDLNLWTTTGVMLSSVDHGDGTETVSYRDAAPVDGRRFVRVRVEKQP